MYKVQNNKVMSQTRSINMTMTFDLNVWDTAWILYVTHGLIMVEIYGKKFENPSMRTKVMARTIKSGRKDAHSHRHWTAIVATMSSSMQAGWTKTMQSDFIKENCYLFNKTNRKPLTFTESITNNYDSLNTCILFLELLI